MRGLVMVLMTLDHASDAFNGGRVLTDAAFLYPPGTPLPMGQFLLRWITHLCAPTFVFLAGTAVALSIEKRVRRGQSQRELDHHLLIRGLFIAALDPLWMSWIFTPGAVLLQVMYAIGISLVCLIPLRRLASSWLLALAVGILVFGEALAGFLIEGQAGAPPVLQSLLLIAGVRRNHWLAGGRDLFIGYPLLPWLAMMLLGWVFGRFLLDQLQTPNGTQVVERRLFAAGILGLTLFGVVRGLNGYGNMLLLRENHSLVQWLHVSKYPPSLSFVALELGLMALCLWGFFIYQRQVHGARGDYNPLLVFGQTALFFYVLHAHLLNTSARRLGLEHKFGVPTAAIASVAVLALLYPLCLWYRGYKRSHLTGWSRYL
jgi:uncharacterized membrane protein